MLTLLEVQGAIQELSRVKCTSVAGQIVISPASLQNNMIDSWIDLNKNISNLIFSPSEIAIPKSFYQEFFCHLIHLFADFSGGSRGAAKSDWASPSLHRSKVYTMLLSRLTHASVFLYEYMESWKFGVRDIILMK